MSGSSISAYRRSRPSSPSAPLERLADGERRRAPRARPGPALSSSATGGRIEVELLGDDVGDGLAAQRGVEDVRGDLGVEGDRRRRARRGRRAMRATSSGLTSWPTTGTVEPLEQAAQRRPRPRRPRPRRSGRRVPATAKASGEPRRGRGSSSSSPTPTAGWAASHGSSAAIRVAGVDLDPRRVRDRRGERGRQVARVDSRPRRRVGVGAGRGRVGRAGGGRGAAGRDTASKSSDSWSPPPSRRRRGPAGPTPSRPAAPARRRAPPAPSRSVADARAAPRPRRPARLAGHRRQALDQRPELVLAEQPDDRLAVVVAEPRRLEVELDRQVADDRR